ncbi:MAG: anaerobic sulfatase maturase [Bryobacterales bacterium]|nr:anaerobic sulfatase maturase [Bryobacterales bacterium]
MELASFSGPPPRITSLLIKPASALCNLDCAYCFYLDRATDPYHQLKSRTMTLETLETLVDRWLFYSYPESVLAFQGGEPTLAGLPFYRRLVEFEQRHGRNGQNVSNALQTNGMLLDRDWCRFFRDYNWLIGISLDGPEAIHNQYRVNKAGHPTYSRVMQSVELMQKHKVEFNVLCVLSKANVGKARELYRFYRKIGVDNLQFIPLSEFDPNGNALPFTVTAEEYGRFLCEIFDLWWPDRRKVRLRFFDNLAEALAGQKPGTCTMHRSCDSYVVVEYNGDVYPCDFFVEGDWKLGNVTVDSFPELARRQKRFEFASKKSLPHQECQECTWRGLCHGGCPKSRQGRRGQFEDLDHFCESYKMAFEKSVPALREEVRKILSQPHR